MSNSKLEETKRNFALDLRNLRKQRGISLDVIIAETKIIKTVLEDFEINCLHRNKRFNKVYLHSLVRAYAKALDLDVHQILVALDLALEGKYKGQLNPEYQYREKQKLEKQKISEEEEKKTVKPDQSPTKKSAKTKEPSKGASPPKSDKRTSGG